METKPENHLAFGGKRRHQIFIRTIKFFPQQLFVGIIFTAGNAFQDVEKWMAEFLFCGYLNDPVTNGRAEICRQVLNMKRFAIQPDVRKNVLDDVFCLFCIPEAFVCIGIS